MKLELLSIFYFSDTVTYSDYLKEKEDLYNKNVGFDTYTSIFQNNILEGLTNYNLINITEDNPYGMSVFWYIFFVLIGMAQIYKIYINSKYVFKNL